MSVPGGHTSQVGRYRVICPYVPSTSVLYLCVKRPTPLHGSCSKETLKMRVRKSSFIQLSSPSLTIMCTGQMPFPTSLKTSRSQHKEMTLAGKAINLVFDELRCRLLIIQLVAQPHEKWSKLILPQSDVSVLRMVPGNQNDSMSQTGGRRKKDRQTMACTLLGARDTIKEVLSQSEGEKGRTEDNQKNPCVQKEIHQAFKSANKQTGCVGGPRTLWNKRGKCTVIIFSIGQQRARMECGHMSGNSRVSHL